MKVQNKLETPHNIKIVEGPKLYDIDVPRPVPTQLLNKTKVELERMVELGVVDTVTKPKA